MRSVFPATLLNKRSSVSRSSGGGNSEGYLAANLFSFGMVSENFSLDIWVHPAVDSAYSLHEANGIPMNVVIDQTSGILKIKAFR